VTFQTALILIFKCAATLCLSGISTKLALAQAESNYWKANIAFKIQEHFTASYQQYTTEQLISYLMGTDISLLSFTPIKIIAHITFKAMYAIKIGNRDIKKKIYL
jgi:hypothetical protein